MRSLSIMDLGFLSTERREMPMHVASLFLFEPPPGAGPEFIRNTYESMLAEQQFRPPFDDKLDYSLSRLGMPRWVKDEHLDPGYHLRHLALPAPGRYRELFSLVSRLHGILLDRGRPLWEAHLIEGLQDGKFAIYMKVHHGLIDGVGSMRLVQKSLSGDPDERGMRFAWSAEIHKGQRSELPPPPVDRGAMIAAAEVVGAQLKTVPGVSRALLRTAMSARIPRDTRMALPFEAPNSPLNTPVTGARRFVAQSYSLERIHAVGKRYGAKVNDIVLAMCANALRRYLDEFAGGVPDKPLVAMVPVSIRPKDADAFGNGATSVLVNLGTHIADPIKRFETIRTSMADAKALVQTMSFNEMMYYTAWMAGPVMVPAMVGLGAIVPSVNVVISNVTGPRTPLYWNGARLRGMYPASILFHGMALNITLVSNGGHVDFGIVACRKSLPSIQRFIDFLEEGLAELERGAPA